MPSYRDRSGKFTTRSIWETLFPPEPAQEPTGGSGGYPNWGEEVSDTGNSLTWSAGGNPLDQVSLDESSFPDGFQSFQVRFLVDNDPRYPYGYASYGTQFWTEWPPRPNWGNKVGARGIGAIVFYR